MINTSQKQCILMETTFVHCVLKISCNDLIFCLPVRGHLRDPQTKKWEMMHPVNRKFTIDMSKPSTSESNMFAMPGIIFDTTENGIILAKVYGPLNESAIPLRKSIPIKNGQTAITAAKKGSPYPVGQPIPNKN